MRQHHRTTPLQACTIRQTRPHEHLSLTEGVEKWETQRYSAPHPHPHRRPSHSPTQGIRSQRRHKQPGPPPRPRVKAMCACHLLPRAVNPHQHYKGQQCGSITQCTTAAYTHTLHKMSQLSRSLQQQQQQCDVEV
ncbi:hypothetical protein DQ04_24241000 [Trypanosoma grayi]|uniref:hypothetical protein n=1 Tax=Trypanosoma grayi TaxID=71804 RepID=UPI0004F47B7C|nr:hypothetical protein DQ04_24241000 [Trypanosoma grayi]KEG05273.1 hypothetical protein DQ04_24241000 [Trypanosoma grayi]